MNIIIVTAIFAAALAFVLGLALCIFRKVFHVETDVLVGLIRETLPGANCGACGFPGCDGFAAACAAQEAAPGKCTVSDAESTKKRAALVGGSGDITPLAAVVTCQGVKGCALEKGIYTGLKTCRAAKIASNGVKVCSWGCIGFGDCVKACPFGAIAFGEGGVPAVDRAKCRGCKLCATECPQGVIRMVKADDKGALAFCNNRNPIKAAVRKACKAGCIKCELCVKKCPAQAIVMNSGVPKIDYAKCTSCGECVEKCPQKVLRLIA